MLPSRDKTKLQLTPKSAVDRFAVLTGHGRSAIAVIGLRGTTAQQIVRRCFAAASASELSTGQVRYGNWAGARCAETAGESVVLTPIAEGHFEIHCHGGPAAIGRIIADLVDCGAIQVAPEDWKFSENLLIFEAQQVLSRCMTARTAAIAMDQVRGALAHWVTDWIEKFNSQPLAAISMDHAITLAGLQQQTHTILACAAVTTRLTEPFRVVLVGPPNVGKSSLVNAILGYDRSITFDQPGTTRDVLHADTVIDGLPVRLSDTAGIRDSDQVIESQGIARAKVEVDRADLILNVYCPQSRLLELGRGVGDGKSPVDSPPAPAILRVLNKIDLIEPNSIPQANVFSTNALTGVGISSLLRAIGSALGKAMPAPGAPAPLCRRQVSLLTAIAKSKEREESLSLLEELLGRSGFSESPEC